jgi:uncharacterized protein Usg
MASRDFRRMIEGYGLTTANILYRLPDYPAIVQSYVWQEYDLHPHFPELCGIFGDDVNQAADFFSEATSIPSRNVAPLTTFGN